MYRLQSTLKSEQTVTVARHKFAVTVCVAPKQGDRVTMTRDCDLCAASSRRGLTYRGDPCTAGTALAFTYTSGPILNHLKLD